MRKTSNLYQDCSQIKCSNKTCNNDRIENHKSLKSRLHRQNLHKRKKSFCRSRLYFRVKLTYVDCNFKWNKRLLYSHCRLQYDNDWNEERSLNFDKNFVMSQIEFTHEIRREILFSNQSQISQCRSSDSKRNESHKFLKSYQRNSKSRILIIFHFKLKTRSHNEIKIKFKNDITMYNNAKTTEKFKNLIKKYSKIWTKNTKLMNIFIEDYMSIILKFNWAKNLKSNRIYSLRIENRKIVDEIFDVLHWQNKMKWFIKTTLFDYSIFVTWRTVHKNKKFIKKNRDWHKKIERDSEKECLFHVLTDEYNRSDCRSQIYYYVRRSSLFLSMRNKITEQTQTNNHFTQRSRTV